MSKQWFLFLFLAFIYYHSIACRCQGTRLPFHEAATNADLVIRGKVIQFKHFDFPNHPLGDVDLLEMKVEVQEVMKGQERNEVISIWGDNALTFRRVLPDFEEGSVWLLGLKKEDQSSPKPEYGISSDDVNWLRVHDGKVSFRIENELQEYDCHSYHALILSTIKLHPDGIGKYSYYEEYFAFRKQFGAKVIDKAMSIEEIAAFRANLTDINFYRRIPASTSNDLYLYLLEKRREAKIYIRLSSKRKSPVILKEASSTRIGRTFDWHILFIGSLLWALCLGWMCKRKSKT